MYKLTEQLTNAIEALRGERARIDNRIAALELAYEEITGERAPTTVGDEPAESRRAITRERGWEPRTYEALKRHGDRGTSVKTLARELKIGAAATGTRLGRLAKAGKAVRVVKGRYKAVAP